MLPVVCCQLFGVVLLLEIWAQVLASAPLNSALDLHNSFGPWHKDGLWAKSCWTFTTACSAFNRLCPRPSSTCSSNRGFRLDPSFVSIESFTQIRNWKPLATAFQRMPCRSFSQLLVTNITPLQTLVDTWIKMDHICIF